MIDKLIIGISGASGAIYAKRLLKLADDPNREIHLIVTAPAIRVMQKELAPAQGPLNDPLRWLAPSKEAGGRIVMHSPDDIGAGPASGSFAATAMIVAPCSMKTLAAISHGYADNLLTRAADVIVKENRKLVLIPREAPFSPIHLKNMLALAEVGVSIVPACPGFYHRPQNIEELVDSVVYKALSQAGIDHPNAISWP